MKAEEESSTCPIYVYSHGEQGYVRLIETWGSDQQIIEAARMSTQKGFLGWGTPEAPKDEKLLRYLWENKHHTPFEQCGMTFEVKTPIFITREFQRHRTLSFNEMSARYSAMPFEDYSPSTTQLLERSQPASSNKQQASATQLSETDAVLWQRDLLALQHEAERVYKRGIEVGVPRELARLATLVSRMSVMRVSGNLRNWFHFLGLRLPTNAQEEIREVAQAILFFSGRNFPRATGLFKESYKNG